MSASTAPSEPPEPPTPPTPPAPREPVAPREPARASVRRPAGRDRAACLAALAEGTARFLAPRRPDCPWCGSLRLRTRLRSGDLRLRKPGRFAVDACRDCGHAFLNPSLTAEGVDFYRWGGQEEAVEHVPERLLALRGSPRRRRRAARALAPLTEPESWLDVGTGHARFPDVAREVFPYTAFDGLDATRRVERARAAGRIEEAHVGRLTDPHISARLRARYDVVSMFHHLELAPDPRAELCAALDVLRPGGHLVVESADPCCLSAALLGKWWLPHDPPRRLHLLPPRNLCAELTARGCTVVGTDHRVHVPHDLAGALSLAVSHVLPAPDTPWRALPPGPLRRALRTPLLRAGLPLVAAAGLADHLLTPLLRRTPFANTYRVIARKERP
ncbi:methyltransferase type 12 [Streptomyces fumigatiscleroticus]|nr:methyltransferase type 12 [Streptomyces fumigatiscleroticus]